MNELPLQREWYLLQDFELDTSAAFFKMELERAQRPKDVFIDDIRRAVEAEFVVRRLASWLERRIVENHGHDVEYIAGGSPKPMLAFYEARLRYMEATVRYLYLRVAAKHTEADKQEQEVRRLSKELDKHKKYPKYARSLPH